MEDIRIIDGNMIVTSRRQSGEAQRLGIPGRPSKLLFLARPFPPFRVTASVRTWNIAKYLARLGWDITVVTPDPSVWRRERLEDPKKVTAEIEREGIRRILTDHRWRCLVPNSMNCWNHGLGWVGGGIARRIAQRLSIDRGVGWVKSAERACSHLTSKDVDVILATAPPFASFKLAKRLSDRLGRPYVLDYRDLWSKNAHNPMPAAARKEAKLLAGCAAVTTVSPSWGSIMEKQFGVGHKLQVVSNGYDPEELADVRPYNFGHFAIVYTGTFYPPARVISPVIAALKRLKETTNGKGDEWFFHYYGPHESHVREEAKRFGVMERAILHGRVPWAEALSAVRGAGVSVVITSVDDEATTEEKGIVPAKVFEALGIGTRVLLITPFDSDANQIATSTELTGSFTGSQTEEIAAFLATAMRGCPPKLRHADTYSWENIVKTLDAALREAMNKDPYNSGAETSI